MDLRSRAGYRTFLMKTKPWVDSKLCENVTPKGCIDFKLSLKDGHGYTVGPPEALTYNSAKIWQHCGSE